MNTNHKPECMANISCAVYHADGICPGPYGKCTCGDLPTNPMNTNPKEDWKKSIHQLRPVVRVIGISDERIKDVFQELLNDYWKDLEPKLDRLASSLLEQQKRELREVISAHNARILNEFQLQGTSDMPMVAYDERLCLVPSITKATEQTLAFLEDSNNTNQGSGD